ncbi:hypothetical protein TNCV_1219641 [Trichonephila clavipes]|nr:hypothetical protein TNCV_1219641 [Trichonephila clavipes]
MDSWLACHEFEPCTAEDFLPYRAGRCTLNLSMSKYPPFGVMRKFGVCVWGLPAQVSSSFGHGSKLKGSSPRPLVQLYTKCKLSHSLTSTVIKM